MQAPRARGRPQGHTNGRREAPGRRCYRVDATFGTPVRVGQRVRPGERLGLTPSRQEVLASEVGKVAQVVFEPSTHTFVITVVPIRD